MVWATHEIHRDLNLNFSFGWPLGKDPNWLCPWAVIGSCECMQRFLSSAAFSVISFLHQRPPGLPFGSEPSPGSNVRQGSKTAELTSGTSRRMVSYHGSVAPSRILPPGFKSYKWDRYFSVRDRAASPVAHPHKNSQDQAITESQNHWG